MVVASQVKPSRKRQHKAEAWKKRKNEEEFRKRDGQSNMAWMDTSAAMNGRGRRWGKPGRFLEATATATATTPNLQAERRQGRSRDTELPVPL